MEPLTGLERIYDEDYDFCDSDDDFIRGSDSEAEDERADDFEMEMQAELTRKMARRREQQMGDSSSRIYHQVTENLFKNEEVNVDARKDNDDDDEDEDADPLYDPFLDDEDERWVDERRRQNIQAHLHGGQQNRSLISKTRQTDVEAAPLRQSDAVLNCPACMTLLCRDCQRHAVYRNQYRAMFVENCRTDENIKLSCPLKRYVGECSERSKKRRRLDLGATASRAAKSYADTQEEYHPTEQATDDTPQSDLFHPVFCDNCNTQVAVMGAQDEVYHFYNILTSH
ncbi:E2F-associated phosphoprotein-like [Varroa destructor]|uniref:E2F-associated phosphoprotein n=1 Tax=Varroa destructor TaxID=109461 RepID=A0A7M7JK15_VARDE|nr:E2F-associated phosphoprotein-like [Varroa destructor]XP_022651601.1 E2F-associated phosphoprotein-like [Varroa destructor]